MGVSDRLNPSPGALRATPSPYGRGEDLRITPNTVSRSLNYRTAWIEQSGLVRAGSDSKRTGARCGRPNWGRPPGPPAGAAPTPAGGPSRLVRRRGRALD